MECGVAGVSFVFEDFSEIEVSQPWGLGGNEGDGGAGVRFEDLKEVEVLWTCSLSDLGEMEEP